MNIKSFKNLKLYISISTVWVIFLLHPIITKSTFSLFECENIDKDQYKMRTHLEYEWYSTEHIMWIIILGVPSLTVWIIGIPLVALIILLINRESLLESGPVRKVFLVLYQGLKQSAFYWEFVNTLRKVVLVFLNAFFSMFSVYYTGLMSVWFLFIMTWVQVRVDPYEDERYNKVEIRALVAGTMTLFSGILFDQEGSESQHPTLILIVVILLILVNLSFVIEWIYIFILTLNIKNVKMQIFLQLLASLIFERYEFQEWIDTNSTNKRSDENIDFKEENQESQSIRVEFSKNNIKNKPNSCLAHPESKNGKFYTWKHIFRTTWVYSIMNWSCK